MADLVLQPLETPREPFLAALRAVIVPWRSAASAPRLTVAFSGGLDSTVLLAALGRLDLGLRLRAAHVDHGLHPQAVSWSEHCARTAAKLGVEFTTVKVAVDRASGQGLEAAARDARYQALGGDLMPGELLLTAHHADDQLETLLLRFLRGAGVRGLRGIVPFGPFGVGFLGRPLLAFTRAELRAQATAWALEWLEDPSNREPRHDRNFLRLKVLPELLARWPAAVRHAERMAEQMHDAEAILDAVAAEDAAAQPAPWCVPREVFAALDPARQRNLLRHVVRRAGLGTPSARKIEELRGALLDSHGSAQPLVRWPGGEGRVSRQRLYVMAPLPPASARDCSAVLVKGASWSGPEGGVTLVPALDRLGLPESWVEQGLTLRFRAGGERFQPLGRRHHHTLKHLFQETGVVPWMRSRVPLLHRGDTLVAVGDWWVTADVALVAASEARWSVQWTGHPPARMPETG